MVQSFRESGKILTRMRGVVAKEGLTVDARTRGERSVSVQSVHHCCWVLRSAPAQHEITHLGDLGVGFLFENVARDSDAV